MLARALVVWCALLVCAVLNGAVREAVLTPRLGSRSSHVVSTVLLSAIIVGLAFASRSWIGVHSAADALRVGAIF